MIPPGPGACIHSQGRLTEFGGPPGTLRPADDMCTRKRRPKFWKKFGSFPGRASCKSWQTMEWPAAGSVLGPDSPAGGSTKNDKADGSVGGPLHPWTSDGERPIKITPSSRARWVSPYLGGEKAAVGVVRLRSRRPRWARRGLDMAPVGLPLISFMEEGLEPSQRRPAEAIARVAFIGDRTNAHAMPHR